MQYIFLSAGEDVEVTREDEFRDTDVELSTQVTTKQTLVEKTTNQMETKVTKDTSTLSGGVYSSIQVDHRVPVIVNFLGYFVLR